MTVSPAPDSGRSDSANGTAAWALVASHTRDDPVVAATSRLHASPRTSTANCSPAMSATDCLTTRASTGTTSGTLSATVVSGGTVGVGVLNAIAMSPAPSSGLASITRTTAASPDTSAGGGTSKGLSSSPSWRISSPSVESSVRGTARSTNSSGTFATSKRTVCSTRVRGRPTVTCAVMVASTRRGRKRRRAAKTPSVPSSR